MIRSIMSPEKPHEKQMIPLPSLLFGLSFIPSPPWPCPHKGQIYVSFPETRFFAFVVYCRIISRQWLRTSCRACALVSIIILFLPVSFLPGCCLWYTGKCRAALSAVRFVCCGCPFCAGSGRPLFYADRQRARRLHLSFLRPHNFGRFPGSPFFFTGNFCNPPKSAACSFAGFQNQAFSVRPQTCTPPKSALANSARFQNQAFPKSPDPAALKIGSGKKSAVFKMAVRVSRLGSAPMCGYGVRKTPSSARVFRAA